MVNIKAKAKNFQGVEQCRTVFSIHREILSEDAISLECVRVFMSAWGFRGRLSIKTLEHQNGLASERGHCLKPSAGRLSIKENRRLHPPSMMYALLEIPKQGERVTKAPISMATNSSKPVGSNQKGITERAQHKFEFSSSSSFNVNSLPLCKLFIVISVCRLPVRFLRRHFLKISSKLFKKRS